MSWTSEEEKTVMLSESLNAREPPAVRTDPQMEVEPREGNDVEYTELTLDCLDLKAQEELLAPPHSGD